MLSRSDQESLHRLCVRNREALASAQRAGCFYCCAIFPAAEVVEFVDGQEPETGVAADGVTALCPRCGIDAVIAETGPIVLSPQLLSEMNERWF